jgi:hypothetical protein
VAFDQRDSRARGDGRPRAPVGRADGASRRGDRSGAAGITALALLTGMARSQDSDVGARGRRSPCSCSCRPRGIVSARRRAWPSSCSSPPSPGTSPSAARAAATASSRRGPFRIRSRAGAAAAISRSATTRTRASKHSAGLASTTRDGVRVPAARPAYPLPAEEEGDGREPRRVVPVRGVRQPPRHHVHRSSPDISGWRCFPHISPTVTCGTHYGDTIIGRSVADPARRISSSKVVYLR